VHVFEYSRIVPNCEAKAPRAMEEWPAAVKGLCFQSLIHYWFYANYLHE
jgi:hypothetical protein